VRRVGTRRGGVQEERLGSRGQDEDAVEWAGLTSGSSRACRSRESESSCDPCAGQSSAAAAGIAIQIPARSGEACHQIG
jgi:hypothetical protein